jgi:hypothetical protein
MRRNGNASLARMDPPGLPLTVVRFPIGSAWVFVMNDTLISFRGIAFALLAMLIVALLAGPSFAAAPDGASPDAASIDNSQCSVYQTAGFFTEVAGNRAKIIQLSIVFVLVGIALLFKK